MTRIPTPPPAYRALEPVLKLPPSTVAARIAIGMTQKIRNAEAQAVQLPVGVVDRERQRVVVAAAGRDHIIRWGPWCLS